MRKTPRSPRPRDYEVGYGRPPKANWYKPGQSGCPTGRPKGSKNAKTLANAELRRKVRVTEHGKKQRTLTVQEIAYRRVGDKAMAGDLKALAFLLMQASGAEPGELGATSAATTPEQDLAIIAEFLSRTVRKGTS